jgi:hypothetical protein
VEEIVISQLILLVTAIVLGTFSIYFSSRMKSTLTATRMSYVLAFIMTAGVPILFIVLSPILGYSSYALFGMDEPHWLIMAALVYIGGFFLATNPLSTIIASEVILIEEQTVFFFKTSFPASSSPYQDIWLVSPWVVYVLFYSVVAWLAYRLCVRRIHRVER